MLGLFEKIDPSVIFVIVMVAIGAVQAIMEKLRKSRAERELNEDLTQRAENRSDSIEPIEYDVPLDDAYDQYRHEILDRQQRTLEDLEAEAAPAPAPPPLPDAAPPPIQTHPTDTWTDDDSAPAAPAAPSTPWDQPAPVKERLTAAEQAALSAFQAYEHTSPKHKAPPRQGDFSVRRLLADRSSLRTAVILKEILGTPKGLEE